MHALAKLIERYRIAHDPPLSQSEVQRRARSYDPESGFGGSGTTRINQIINEPQPNMLRTRTLKALAYALGAPPSEIVTANLETCGLPIPTDPNAVDPIVSYIQHADIDERRKTALLANYARHRQALMDEYRTLVQLEQPADGVLRDAEKRFGHLDAAERQLLAALPWPTASVQIAAYRKELSSDGKRRGRRRTGT